MISFRFIYRFKMSAITIWVILKYAGAHTKFPCDTFGMASPYAQTAPSRRSDFALSPHFGPPTMMILAWLGLALGLSNHHSQPASQSTTSRRIHSGPRSQANATVPANSPAEKTASKSQPPVPPPSLSSIPLALLPPLRTTARTAAAAASAASTPAGALKQEASGVVVQ